MRRIIIMYEDDTTGQMLRVQGVVNRDDFANVGSMSDMLKATLRELLRTADFAIAEQRSKTPRLSDGVNSGNTREVLGRFFKRSK